MATRHETNQRRGLLQNDLRESFRTGRLSPGEALPPVTEMATRYDLSVTVVRQALQPLVNEGLLYIIPRVGTFVGRPKTSISESYLFLGNDTLLRHGFEQRIAQLGGSSIAMEREFVASCWRMGELPQLSGIFDPEPHRGPEAPWRDDPTLARVCFHSSAEPIPGFDVVSFDDVSGGKTATRHLLGLGHRRIAFLGLHMEDRPCNEWSRLRAEGWRQEMEEAGNSCAGLLITAPYEADNPDDQVRATRESAESLLRMPNVGAVVAANDKAAEGLLEALAVAGVPTARWPAVVGFDDALAKQGRLITSLALPWDEIGAEAAELLWARRHGRLTGPFLHRYVGMRLIVRLTSTAQWSVAAGAGVLRGLPREKAPVLSDPKEGIP